MQFLSFGSWNSKFAFVINEIWCNKVSSEKRTSKHEKILYFSAALVQTPKNIAINANGKEKLHLIFQFGIFLCFGRKFQFHCSVSFEFAFKYANNKTKSARKKNSRTFKNGSCSKKKKKIWWWWRRPRRDEKFKTKFLPVRTSVNTFTVREWLSFISTYLQPFALQKWKLQKKLMLWGYFFLFIFLLNMNSKQKETNAPECNNNINNNNDNKKCEQNPNKQNRVGLKSFWHYDGKWEKISNGFWSKDLADACFRGEFADTICTTNGYKKLALLAGFVCELEGFRRA